MVAKDPGKSFKKAIVVNCFSPSFWQLHYLKINLAPVDFSILKQVFCGPGNFSQRLIR